MASMTTTQHPWESPPDWRELPAEYDARYKVIETAELERLQNLERKIAAFLGDARDAELHGLTFNTMRIGRFYGSYHVVAHGKRYEHLETLAHAMLKAFELFEVPE